MPPTKHKTVDALSPAADFPKAALGLYPDTAFVWLNDVAGGHAQPAMRLSDGAITTITPGIVDLNAGIGLRRFILTLRENGTYGETGEAIRLDNLRDELIEVGVDLADPKAIEKAVPNLSAEAQLEYYVFTRAAEAHVPNNGWNYTWPHLYTELMETPQLRGEVIDALVRSMSQYPNKFTVLGVQRRYLLYFADSSPGKQQLYVSVAHTPEDGPPFKADGTLKAQFAKSFTPHDYKEKKSAPEGQPLIYRGVAWVVRFLLDDQAVAFGNCRVYVGEGDHPGFTDGPLPVGHFYCSDWCQRHDFTSYGKGINLQFADFTFDGWVMGACLPYAMTSGAYMPPSKMKPVSKDVRSLMESEKLHRIPSIEEIMAELRANRPTLDNALADLASPITDAEAAVRQVMSAILLDYKQGAIRNLVGVPMVLSPALVGYTSAEASPSLKATLDEAGLVHLPLSDPRSCPSYMVHVAKDASPEERMKVVPPSRGCILSGAYHTHPEKVHVTPDIPALERMIREIIDARIEVEQIEAERIEAERIGRDKQTASPPWEDTAVPFGEAGSDATAEASQSPALDADVVAMADKLAAEAAASFFPPLPGEDGYTLTHAVAESAPGPLGTEGIPPEAPEGLFFRDRDGYLRMDDRRLGELPVLDDPDPMREEFIERFVIDESRVADLSRYQYDHENPTIAECRSCNALIDCRARAMMTGNFCYCEEDRTDHCLALACALPLRHVAPNSRFAYLDAAETDGITIPGADKESVLRPSPIIHAPKVLPGVPVAIAQDAASKDQATFLRTMGFSLSSTGRLQHPKATFCEGGSPECTICKRGLADVIGSMAGVLTVGDIVETLKKWPKSQ